MKLEEQEYKWSHEMEEAWTPESAPEATVLEILCKQHWTLHEGEINFYLTLLFVCCRS